MTVKLTPKLLIPAAGFGKRVGSPEAKELLPDPETGRPLIQFGLDLALKRGWMATVITRPDKKSLVQFLERRPGVEVSLVSSSREWPESLLLAQNHWGENNIVLLPDTRFAPASILDDMDLLLRKQSEVVFATFETQDPQNWGVVKRDSKGQWLLCEKPQNAAHFSRAWGLFGFQFNSGEALLAKMLESTLHHTWFPLPHIITEVPLKSFIDLTRPQSSP